MENKELSDYLEQTNNNLEEAIQLLQVLSLDKQDLPRRFAMTLVERFGSASKEEAVAIAADAFKEFYREMKSQEAREHKNGIPAQESLRLQDGIKKLVDDNSTLKRAVVKLKEKADCVQAVESENLTLKTEVQQLNIANYMLRMHLQNAMEGKTPIEKSKDIF